MSKRLVLVVSFLLVSSLFLSAAMPAGWGKYRVTVKNSTHTKVYLKFEGVKNYYYLKVNPGTKKVYTMKKDTYKATFWGCYSKKVVKNWSLNRQYKILFPKCNARDHGNEMGVLRILFPEQVLDYDNNR